MKMLEAHNLAKSYAKRPVVKDVSLTVKQGEIVGLLGPNGAGKTTVFNVMSGFLTPDQGIVRFDGKKLKHIKTHHLTKLGISRTLQGVGLFASLTALENVMLGGSAWVKSGIVADSLGAPWADSAQNKLRAQAMEIMGEFGIADSADRYPGELPYPVQKRVAIARSLISDPKVLLLDEPAGGISAGDMAELGRMIRSWTPERTVLLVEHHMELVMEVCDLIWVLDAGKVIASGTPAQVRTNPAVLAAYLGEDGGNADVGNG
jgi:branched-chain amino acid transport system ATP-binding protein